MFSFAVNAVGKVLRVSGQGLDRVGRMLEVSPYIEKRNEILFCYNNSLIIIAKLISSAKLKFIILLPLSSVSPSLRAQKFKNTLPAMKGSFIASSTAVVGNVSIGSNSSVWYGAVLRGMQ